MADNITITEGENATPPDGTIIATDQVGTVHYQVIKLALGADGAATLLSIGQQLMAACLPVVLASNHGDIKITLDGETITLAGSLPDTAAGDLAAIAAALGAALPVDATGAGDVPVTLDGEGVGVSSVTLSPTLVHGKKVVAVPGTEEALAGSTALTSGVTVKALHTNTNMVYVGANPVTSATGFVLDAGEEIFIEIANLATIYIDVDTAGEGVTYIGS